MRIIGLIALLLSSNLLLSQKADTLPFLTQMEITNQVHINTNTDQPVEVKVYDSRGKVISFFTVRRKDVLHLNNLIPGTYHVTAVINGKKESGTFTKN